MSSTPNTTRTSVPLFAVLAALTAAVLTTPGCENEGAQQRAEAKQLIGELSAQLHHATLNPIGGDADSTQKTTQKLEEVVRKIEGLRGVDDGLEAAGALLAAAAHRHLAALSVAEAQEIETANRQTRSALHSGIDAAMRLAAAADGREQVNTDVYRGALDGLRQNAESELRDYSSRLAALDGPIMQRMQENSDDSVEAMRLEQEAGRLRRQAIEQGPAQALGTVMEALDLEREADRYETKIAGREIELQYDLQPEHDLAQTRAESVRGRLGEIGAAVGALDRRDEVAASQIRATRDVVAAFRSRIDDAIDVIDERTSGALDAHYAAAAQQLEQAIAKATRAATTGARGGSGGGSADLAVARALSEQGRMLAMKARGLSGQQNILERLAAAGGALGDASSFRSAAAAAADAEREVVEQAKAAYDQAKERLDRVKGNDSREQVEAFKRSLEIGRAALSGEPLVMDTGMPAGASRPGARGGGPGMSGMPAAKPSRGFATPEEIVDLLRQTSSSEALSAMSRLLEGVHTTDPQLQTIVAVQRDLIDALTGLGNAVREQFGDAGDAFLTQMMSMGGDAQEYADARLESQDDATASVSFKTADGAKSTMTLLAVDGEWFLDAEAFLETQSVDDGMGGALDKGMTEFMMMMMSEVAEGLRKGTALVESGAYATIEEMQAAMMGEMGSGGMPTDGP